MNLARFRTPAFKDNEKMEHVVISLEHSNDTVRVAHLCSPKDSYTFKVSDCYISIIQGVKVRLK